MKDDPSHLVSRFFIPSGLSALEREGSGKTLEKVLEELSITVPANDKALEKHELKDTDSTKYLKELSKKLETDKDYIDKILGKK